MNKNKKKGFTIVELVIVIAVIGILTAVLIPVISGLVHKANVAADSALVNNINRQLEISEVEEGKNVTMHDALQDAEKAGYIVSSINARSDNDLVWDQDLDRFLLLDKNDDIIAGRTNNLNNKHRLWKIYSSLPQTQTFSIYASNSFAQNEITVTVGFDSGNYKNMTSVSYVRNQDNVSGHDVTIRTGGDQTVLTIDAAKDNVDFYGFAKNIAVTEVNSSSLHIYGSVNDLAVSKGHVKVEETGIIFNVSVLDTSDLVNPGSITNTGYIADASSETIKEEIASAQGSKAVGGDYEISNLMQLESFRDAVNSGNSFEGKVVKLTADITLNNGWRPIGEGTRKVGAEGIYAGMKYSGSAFAGEFDGNNKTIYNLNNKGFTPTSSRVSSGIYAYGLFALTTSGANIHDLTLSNVDIDTSRYGKADGDSVGALIGFSAGSLVVDNINVIGTSLVKATDGVGSIVGRCYNQSSEETITVTITNCTSNATVSAFNASGSKVGGIMGYVQLRKGGGTNVGCPFLMTDCVFTGTKSNAMHMHDLYVYGAQVELVTGSQEGLLI